MLGIMNPIWTTEDIIRGVKAFRENSGTMKIMCLWALGERIDRGEIRPEHAEIVLPALIEALDSNEWKIRSITCGVLGFYGVTAQPALQRLHRLAESDPEDKVRSEAAKAAVVIGAT